MFHKKHVFSNISLYDWFCPSYDNMSPQMKIPINNMTVFVQYSKVLVPNMVVLVSNLTVYVPNMTVSVLFLSQILNYLLQYNCNSPIRPYLFQFLPYLSPISICQ